MPAIVDGSFLKTWHGSERSAVADGHGGLQGDGKPDAIALRLIDSRLNSG